jgi:hypothetical protein
MPLKKRSSYTIWLSLVFAQDLMPLQTEGPPIAINLIAISDSLPETILAAFGTLNTSNQSRDIQKILFPSIRFHVSG